MPDAPVVLKFCFERKFRLLFSTAKKPINFTNTDNNNQNQKQNQQIKWNFFFYARSIEIDYLEWLTRAEKIHPKMKHIIKRIICVCDED